jgi:Na+/H+-dicarboxylate symporter
MLKCIIIPLVIPSLIVSVGSPQLSMTGKIGRWIIIYFIATTGMFNYSSLKFDIFDFLLKKMIFLASVFR